MLGKLIKNEFRNVGRLLLLINVIVLGMHMLSIVFESVYNSRVLNNTVFEPFFAIFASAYVLSIIAVNIIILLVFAVRFYRKVYSVEGYLTHTLPVKKSDIYFAMLVSAGLSTVITALVSLVYPLTRLTNEILVQGRVRLSEVLHFAAKYHVTGHTFFLIILTVFCSIFAMFALVFLCVSIGQNWKTHPVLGSILAYFGLVTALEVFVVITFVTLADSKFAHTIFKMGELPGDVMNTMSCYSIVIAIIGTAIMSVISIFIMKRKLDLQ